MRRRRPLMEREYVGIDFRRRRSVIVRLSPSGERLSVVRINDTPEALTSRHVADDVWFPNGMVVLGEDTLVLAESHADRLTAWTITDSGELVDRRVWAALGPGAAPDGICADAEGAIWYASVPASAAPGSPREATCCRPSRPTAIASPACSAAKTVRPSMSWPTTTAATAPPTASC
jgi:hypothetical protein